MTARWCVVGSMGPGEYALADVAPDGTESAPVTVPARDLPQAVAAREAEAQGDGSVRLRWVWSDTSAWYPLLQSAGVRVERCHDLRLAHAILSRSSAVPHHGPLLSGTRWDAPSAAAVELPEDRGEALFDTVGITGAGESARTVPHDLASALAEFSLHRAAQQAAREADRGAGARLRLLLAAESAGALIAVEMRTAGVPWDAEEHARILTDALGPRTAWGTTPTRMHETAQEVRAALGDAHLDLDSHAKLLRALRHSGISVDSTSQWELREHDHPAIEPLLRYRKLSRLHTANGWAWMDTWVRAGRYRPVYVPGGVVTGRWASVGGGALQIPRMLRPALRADPGWRLVSADASQLEPRVLAAMAGDRAMAQAGAGTDLYAGIVETGAVASREEAKIAVLGAMYGSTTGASGRLVPQLRRTFPAAMRLVDGAAALGERGDVVSTWLGRTSPPLPAPDTEADPAGARRIAGDQGRFTRNFVVQGTAAEWALTWLALLRARLDSLPAVAGAGRAHLVFFLHDEVIVHAPAVQAEAAAEAVRASAVRAGALLFPGAPVDFPLDLRISERAEK